MTARWPRRAQQPLKLHRGDDIGIPAVAQLASLLGIVQPVAGSQDHCAYFQRFLVWSLLVVDRVCFAGQHTLVALGAETARQATLCFSQRLLCAQAEFNLSKVAHALCNSSLGCFHPRAGIYFAPRDHTRYLRIAQLGRG